MNERTMNEEQKDIVYKEDMRGPATHRETVLRLP